jgi:predicted house-cleaning noncanonical NTP pyrophosphatase (MazG superfamily)
MRSFLLHKLVRDKVFANMQELGQQITSIKLGDEQFLTELKKKLIEEASEVSSDSSKTADELADLLEVIEQLGKQLGYTMGDLQGIQLQRRAKRGAFDGRNYVERLDLNDDDPWVQYYAKEPQRFQEAVEE